ncbi:unnamed protein product [Cuscuta campestris]|uniref:Uncharacterized protein n=1 Tax=Cuscuta campestris TaxID=132261 RepID=A0A484NK34_9ASTE|nr:unnamed protein product [Cuscuta campestris]
MHFATHCLRLRLFCQSIDDVIAANLLQNLTNILLHFEDNSEEASNIKAICHHVRLLIVGIKTTTSINATPLRAVFLGPKSKEEVENIGNGPITLDLGPLIYLLTIGPHGRVPLFVKINF